MGGRRPGSAGQRETGRHAYIHAAGCSVEDTYICEMDKSSFLLLATHGMHAFTSTCCTYSYVALRLLLLEAARAALRYREAGVGISGFVCLPLVLRGIRDGRVKSSDRRIHHKINAAQLLLVSGDSQSCATIRAFRKPPRQLPIPRGKNQNYPNIAHIGYVANNHARTSSSAGFSESVSRVN